MQREGRKFFGCDSLPGIPIEDIARPGTGGAHFEKRVFSVCMHGCEIELCTLCSYLGVLTLTKNEALTGSVGASNAPFSRFTLALYEDSG